jgi:hypothetical protein
MRKIAMPELFANSRSLEAHSRTWVTLPAPDSSSGM